MLKAWGSGNTGKMQQKSPLVCTGKDDKQDFAGEVLEILEWTVTRDQSLVIRSRATVSPSYLGT